MQPPEGFDRSRAFKILFAGSKSSLSLAISSFAGLLCLSPETVSLCPMIHSCPQRIWQSDALSQAQQTLFLRNIESSLQAIYTIKPMKCQLSSLPSNT